LNVYCCWLLLINRPVPIMFSVWHPPSHQAANLQSGIISNFSNTQHHFKIQQIRKNQLHSCNVNQYMSFFYVIYPFVLYVHSKIQLPSTKISIDIYNRSNYWIKCLDQHVVSYRPLHYINNKLQLHINSYIEPSVNT
jgi:hypothetical protein